MSGFKLKRLGLVIDPKSGNPLEAEGVLNPAAIRGPDGQLYLFPRLIAQGNYSRIGIARVRFSETGDPASVERLGIALEPEADYEPRPNGGGGCEDPRITFVEPLHLYVMTYTVFSAQGPRIALAVSEDLFHWRRLGLASFRPYHGIEFEGVDNKEASVFPVAIPDPSGQPAMAILHRPLFSWNSSRGNGVPPNVPRGGSPSREHLDFLLLNGNRRLRATSPVSLWLPSSAGHSRGALGAIQNPDSKRRIFVRSTAAMKSILAALRRQVSMNFLRAIRMTAVFLLLATPADSRSAEIGWEALNQEAVDLYRAGDYDRALEVAKRALEVAGKALGPDHPDVAANLNNLAALYYAQGDYAQAEPLFKRALAISEKALGPEHPNVATSLNNLATLYYAQGDYAQAEPLFKRALAIRERALGPDHPDVATSLNNLAELYSTQGNYAQAERLFKRSLAISEKALGPEHPGVATSLNGLAALYLAQEQYAQAERLFKRSLVQRQLFLPIQRQL